ncbi:MAG: hypothetical protein WCA54_03500, partial [Pseudolabrys sp.]
MSAFGKRASACALHMSAFDPKRTFGKDFLSAARQATTIHAKTKSTIAAIPNSARLSWFIVRM